MSPITHLTAAALEQLAAAQADVDRHVAVGPDGRCLACGAEAPCHALCAANRTLLKYGRLPVRRPGLAGRVARRTHAARRTHLGSGWFGGR